MKGTKAIVILLMSVLSVTLYGQDKDKWVAPESADKLVNKYTSQDDIDLGGDSYVMYCAACHGDTGKGDGPGGVSLPIKPKDFTSKEVAAQTDGALFWKLSEGRGNMIAYGLILSEEERWQIISYVKSLSKK